MEFKKALSCLVIIPLILKVSGQESDTLNMYLKSNIELALTPRFSGIQVDKTSPLDSSFYYHTGLYRLQIGMEVMYDQYLHLFGDYFRVRTDLDFLDKKIDAFGFGIQYSYKFENALVNIGPIKIFKKPTTIRWFPELIISGGLINVKNNSYMISGLVKSSLFHPYGQYGMTWNIYLNSWANVSIMYLNEFFYSLKNDIHRYGPIQTKFVIKL